MTAVRNINIFRQSIKTGLSVLVLPTIILQACFVDPGNPKVEPLDQTSPLHLPIYQAGDFLDYAVTGQLTKEGQSTPEYVSGSLEVEYASTTLTQPSSIISEVLKETTTLTIASSIIQTVRYVSQDSEATIPDSTNPQVQIKNPNFGTLYLHAVDNHLEPPSQVFAWANPYDPTVSTSNTPTKQIVNGPIDLTNVGTSARYRYDIGSNCASNNCSNNWFSLSDEDVFTGENKQGYVFGDTKYGTAKITTTPTVTLPSAGGGIPAEFGLADIDYRLHCARFSESNPSVATPNPGYRDGEYRHKVGLVYAFISCDSFTAGVGSSLYINLIGARIGGKSLDEIL